MSAQYKKIAFLAPRTGMPDDAFRRYWRERHGPLVAGAPGYAAYRQRYVQNHILAPGPVGAAPSFAGMAEFWLPGDNENEFASTPTYRDHIKLDELKFIDMNGTVSMSAQEQVVRPGRGRVKVVVLSCRGIGVNPENFRTEASEYVETALSAPVFGGLVRGWRVDYVVPGSFRLPGARPITALEIDCIQSLWFDSDDEMQAAFMHLGAAPRARTLSERIFSAPSWRSFKAEELVFFDHGCAVA